MDGKKEFLSTINHEIRTPLTSIKGFSETILNSYDKLTDEQKKKFINIIKEQSIRLINLVENALQAADSEVEYNNLVFKKTQINEILNKAIEVIKVNYKDKIFKTSFNNGALFCATDKDALEQIFINLLDNACKYSENSSLIEIKTYAKNLKNYISIKNFGQTIKEEEKDKIFDKFYRTSSYLTSKTQGSGLGLFIVKDLVMKMKGGIEVKSDKNETEFIINFPVFAPEEFIKTQVEEAE